MQALESRELLSNTTLLWSAGVSLPAPRGGASAVAVNGTVVVAGGSTTGSATAVVQGTVTSSTWATLPGSINTGRVGAGFVAASNGLLLYGGGIGINGTTASSNALLYQISGYNSHSVASLSTARMQLAAATDANGQAYAIGGVSNSGANLATVERYNASSNSWPLLAAMPASRSGAAAAFDGSGAIYVAGGSDTANGTTGTTTLYKYTVATNQWTALAALPTPIRDAAAVFAPDGQLDVIGGISNGTTVASVETYDPTTNTWGTNTSLPAAVSSAAAVIDSAGRVEVIGGFDSSKQPMAGVEVSQVVNSPVTPPAFTSSPPPAALTVASGATFTYAAAASGNPLANYSLVSGPAGTAIDPVNGSTTWTVPGSFAGSVPVTLQAANLLGTATQSFTINVMDRTPPTAPGTPYLTDVGATSVTLGWGASTDNIGVTEYSVYWIYTTGHSGRDGGYTTHYVLEATTDGATAATITGLTQNQSYRLYVQARDAAGNTSPYSGPLTVIPGAAPYSFKATQTSPPSPGVTYGISDVANHRHTVQLSATSFSPPVYAVVSPPSGMTLDPATGLVTWTPAASNLGTTSVTFQATNPFGTTSLVVPITVTPDVPIPSFIFGNTDSPTFDIVRQPVSLQITDGSNTPSTFSVVSGPTGLTIDPISGMVSWVPTPDQAGNLPVTFQLTNSFGSATLTLNPVIYVASPPQDVAVSGADTWSPTLSWSPPAYNADLVASYRVVISGPDFYNDTFTTSGSTLSSPLSLAASPVPYQVNIQALDSRGDQGLWNTSLSFVFNPVIPNPSYQILSNNGNASTQAGQPVSIQLYDLNTADTSTFALVSGPAGATVDPTSGLVSWTPTADQVGLDPMTFRLTNSEGSADVSLSIYVGPVTNDTNPPNPTYSFTSNNGGPYAVPGQPMTMQLTDLNTAQPSVFLLQSGPSGMTIDPNTGILTWTPALADLGYVNPVIVDINAVGTSYLCPTIPVVFASTVKNVTASGSLATGSIGVAWADPSATSEPVAGYDVYLSWFDGNGNQQTSVVFVAAGSDSVTLQAVPGVTTYTLTVVAVDPLGRDGAYPLASTIVTLS
jgi:N-acetylneuraminic acid mutarotase